MIFFVNVSCFLIISINQNKIMIFYLFQLANLKSLLKGDISFS